MIRPAHLSDLDALVRLEERCFAGDRLSRRSFRYLLTRANAALLVDDEHGVVRGYALLRFRAGSPRARLYSIAVDPRHHGKGAGRALLSAAEQVAGVRGAARLQLEIRKDNHAAVRLYRGMGYREFGNYVDYYADHMDALRMQKPLLAHPLPIMTPASDREKPRTVSAGQQKQVITRQS